MSYKSIFTIIVIICLTLSVTADKVETLLASFPEVSISISVKSLKGDQDLYSYNSSKLMVPASVTKVFTAYAALELLGHDFTYNTKLLKSNDDIYLKFSGDPSFTKEDLEQLIADLPKIIGNIIIDDFVFDQQYLGNGWAWEDSKFCFSAPVSAIIINRNCFQGTLSPTGLVNHAKIFANIDNQLIPKNDPHCSPHLQANPDNSYNLSGCVNNTGVDIPLDIAYQNPRLMITLMLKDILNARDIGFKGKIIFAETPDNADILATHKSQPLVKLVGKMLKDSDNIYANSLAKTIGAYYYKAQGNFINGVNAIKKITGVSELKIVDGSGNSRYNLISADQLVDLFIKAHNNHKIQAYFHESLAVSGVDGTMKKMFNDHPKLHGEIHAKTGGMAGVSTIVGYYQGYVFAIMINGFTYPISEMHKLQEDLIVSLME